MSRSGWLLCGVLCILAITAGSTWGNQPAGFLYVANGWTGNISAYAIDQATGALAEAPGSPFLAGVNPVSIVADASGRFVYVTNAGTFFTGNTISAFRVDELTGALTPVPGSPFLLPEGSIPQALAADPAGRFLYTTIRFPVSQSGAVAVFGINQTNGALTTSQTLGLPALYTATSLAAEPSGQFLYVASCPPPDPGQTSEHSCNTKAGVVFAFAVSDSGALSKVPSSPFLAGKYPQSIAASPTGLFVYVANFSSHSVSAYGIGALGELSPVPGSPFAAPGASPAASPHAVTVDPHGRFAYLGTNSGDVPSYAIDPNTGALTPAPGSPFPAQRSSFSLAIQTDPAGDFVYTTNTVPNCSRMECIGEVSGFQIDPETGALSPVPGSPFPTNGGVAPRSIAIVRGPGN